MSQAGQRSQQACAALRAQQHALQTMLEAPPAAFSTADSSTRGRKAAAFAAACERARWVQTGMHPCSGACMLMSKLVRLHMRLALHGQAATAHPPASLTCTLSNGERRQAGAEAARAAKQDLLAQQMADMDAARAARASEAAADLQCARPSVLVLSSLTRLHGLVLRAAVLGQRTETHSEN